MTGRAIDLDLFCMDSDGMIVGIHDRSPKRPRRRRKPLNTMARD